MLETLIHLRFSWGYAVTAIVGIVVALAITRATAVKQHRRRIFIIVCALAASVLLHLVAWGLDELFPSGSHRGMHAGAVLLLAFGLTGLLGLVMFDLAFDRARL